MRLNIFYAVCDICEESLPIFIEKLTTGEELQQAIETGLGNAKWSKMNTRIMCRDCEIEVLKLFAKRQQKSVRKSERVAPLYPSEFVIEELIVKAGKYLDKYFEGGVKHVDDIAPKLMQAMRWATAFQATLEEETTTIEMNRQAVTIVPQGLRALEFFGRWDKAQTAIAPPPPLGMGAS